MEQHDKFTMENNALTALTIFKASAGSGKTFTLSATYIAHLLAEEPEEYPHKHQLAVTFTNKATAEMKERIIQYLYSIAMGNDDNDGFFKAVRELVPADVPNKTLRVRARHALYNIIHDYDHFHVTTIDSFFQSLLSSLAHELNLSASFKVEVDNDVLSKAVDRLLTTLDEQGEELKWLTSYIQERMSDDKNWNVSKDLKDLAGELIKESYMLHSALLNRKENQNLPGAINLNNETVAAYKKTIRTLMQDERRKLTSKAKEADDAIEAGPTYANISHGPKWVKEYLCKLMNEDLEFHKISEPSASFRGFSEDAEKMASKAKLKNNPGLIDELETIRPLLAAVVAQYYESRNVINSCHLSLANLNPLRLLEAIDREVNTLNRENDRMLLASTPLLFHDLSADSDASFIFERAGTQYHHVMIDEFQDTSVLQWDNMRKLLVENLAQGNSCMLVGDVKQGIYRWRGGDWNALAGFKEGPNQELNSYINIKTLKTNFRSGEEVVKFNNRLFTSIPAIVMNQIRNVWDDQSENDDEDNQLDIERIYPTPQEDDNHEVTQLTKAPGGYVRIELINNESEEEKEARKKAEKEAKDYAKKHPEEAQETLPEDEEANDAESREAHVAAEMIRLHEVGVPYSEMAILIRSAKDAAPLMKYYEKYHGTDSEHPIALMSEEAFLLESSPSVMTIINALRYVANPKDNIALKYLRMQCPEDVCFDSIKEVLDKWNEEKYSGVPFYEAACRLAEMFRLYDREGQSPYLYNFLDSILAYIDDHSADVNAFLLYWEETLHKKAIPSAAVDGVRILTIHKSKGLAFHSVFIPYCDWQIDSNHKSFIWTKPLISPFNGIPLLPIEMKKETGHSIYREVFRQETFDKYVENLNLLYVAFTRTKQNLFIWADCSKSGIAPLLRDALDTYDELLEFGSPSALFVNAAKNDTEENAKAEQLAASQGKDARYFSNIPTRRFAVTEHLSKSSTPLEYKNKPIFIEFTHYDPKLIFRQSNNAEIFLHPTDEEAEVFANEEDAKAKQEEYRKTGVLLHNLMSSIENESDIDTKIEEASREGQLPPSLSKESVRKLITKRITHPEARAWFDGSWQLYRECSLVFREADENGHIHTVTRRPDRVMMRGNMADDTDETIVVDFKFGKFKTEHREQVMRYMDLIRQQGRHNVKGYLWYLYTGSIEEVL